MTQLELARGEFGTDPLAWSEAAIGVVMQLSLNEAALSRAEIEGRNKLVQMLTAQLDSGDAAKAGG